MARRILIRVLWLLGAAFMAGLVVGAGSPAQADATTDFVTSWKTDNPGVSGTNQIRLPLVSGGSYDFYVDWGDSTTSHITGWDPTQAAHTHTYATAGTYVVTIRFPDPGSQLKGWRFNRTGDEQKILTIDKWGGKINLGNDGFYFYGASNLTSTATDSPDLTGTTTLTWMFVGASNFNGDISGWDTSKVTDMSFMLYGAEAFNQDIGGWDTSSVTNMNSMLYGTTVFNQDLSGWTTDNVQDMGFLFYGANAFNQDIGGWNTSKVKDMSYMFNRAHAFDQDLSAWTTDAVMDMTFMFYEALNFDQDLGGWNVSNVSGMTGMFDLSGLSTANYDKVLVGWSNLPSLKAAVPFGADTVQYSCGAADARASLLTDHGWTIVDGGEDTDGCFETTWNTANTTTGSSGAGQVQLPLEATGTYDFAVSWGDGSSDLITSGTQMEATHTYAADGTYSVRISGQLQGWRFNDSGDKAKILNIAQWGGKINLGNNGGYFMGATNLTSTATDAPDLTGTTTLANMFVGTRFNQNISGWDTKAVTDMSGMFSGASEFNQPLGAWNTAKVTDMANMFLGTRFNQDISGWDTKSVTDMSGMFSGASEFNQPLGAWNTAKVTDMANMFQDATAFNQPIGTWNIASVTDMGSMLAESGLSTSNYDQALIAWAALPSLTSGVPLGAQGIAYSCAAVDARRSLIDQRAWSITDAGVGPCVKVSPDPAVLAATTVGLTSPAATVTVSNSGDSGVILPAAAITLTGADAAQFAVSADGCSGRTVAPAGACSVQLTFAPASAGVKTSGLRVESNAAVSITPVSGTGVLPGFTASPSQLDFGVVTKGATPGPRPVVVSNNGPGTLILPPAGVTVTGNGFTITGDACSDSRVLPGGTCTVQVTFSPAAEGYLTGSLRLVSNAAGSPHTVALSGTGKAKTRQTLSVKLPKRISVNGLTVITPANARTNAGQRVRTVVRGGPVKPAAAGELRYFTVVRGPAGKVSVRTYGNPNVRLRVIQTAPETSEYTAFERQATYLRGKRR